MILHVFSRYIVAWTVQYRENAQLATAAIERAASQQQITPKILMLHADRGAPQRAKPVAFLLADLGITRTHSRPYTSSDNPYSESNFETLKYRPGFPTRLDTIEHACAHCRAFVVVAVGSTGGETLSRCFRWVSHVHASLHGVKKTVAILRLVHDGAERRFVVRSFRSLPSGRRLVDH